MATLSIGHFLVFLISDSILYVLRRLVGREKVLYIHGLSARRAGPLGIYTMIYLPKVISGSKL